MTIFKQLSTSSRMKWPPEYQLRNWILVLVQLWTSCVNLSKPLSLPGLDFHFQVNIFNKVLAQVSFHDKVDLVPLPAAFKASGGSGAFLQISSCFCPLQGSWEVVDKVWNPSSPSFSLVFHIKRARICARRIYLTEPKEEFALLCPWGFLTKTSVLHAVSHHPQWHILFLNFCWILWTRATFMISDTGAQLA